MKEYSIKDIKDANAEAGWFWFEPATMAFFNTVIESKPPIQGPGGVYLITSDRMSPDDPKLYTIRAFDPETGIVCTEGEFRGFDTYADAWKEARRLADLDD